MNKNGVTLVELIVAIATGLIIMLAIYAASEMAQRSSVSIAQKVVTQQDTRAVLDLMAMEIRMASYNPSSNDASITGIWVDKDGSVILSANDKKYMKGIQIANKNEIMIEMDLNSNGKVWNVVDTNCESNEVIYYKFNSVAKTISRQTGCGDVNNKGPLTPILGGAGSATTVANNDTNPVVNLFTYWGPNIDNALLPDIDITDNVSSTTASTAAKWIPQIRCVVITIVADTELQDATTKKKRRMTYSTSVMVRNHVLSPPIPN